MRKLEEILTEINTETDTHQELAALQSNTAGVSWWQDIKQVFAFASLSLENIFEQHQQTVNTLITADAIVGSREWYMKKCYAFQLGDTLLLNNNTLGYATVDPDKCIITRAGVKEDNSGVVQIKVNKGTIGKINPLTETELNAFKAYMGRVKIAGVPINITSLSSDSLSITAKVVLSKQVFDATGKNLNTGNYEVATALRNYLQGLTFDDTVYLSSIAGAMHEVTGVESFWITGITLNGVTVDVNIGQLSFISGYATITDTEAQLNTKMNYQLI